MGSVLRLVLAASGALWLSIATEPLARAHGDIPRGIAKLDSQIEAAWRAPGDSAALAHLLLERGELFRMRRNFDQAARDYDACARLQPDRPGLARARGRLLLDWGRPREALAALQPLLRDPAVTPDIIYMHARALVEVGQAARALRAIDRALRTLPQPEPDHYLARADLLTGLGPAHRRRALAGLDEGIRRLGPVVSLESRAIDIEIALRRHDQALARIDRQAAAAVRKDVWLARRADVLDRAGRPASAQRARRQALEAQRALPPALQARAATRDLRDQLLAALDRAPPPP
jgi:tetratricopeptide (TPR) repeat protein